MSHESIGREMHPIGQNPANPFVCNICKKTYTRLDHLGRHYRSHAGDKPFTCDKCGKSFTRVDLLRRHRNNHADGEVVKTPARHRTAKACPACAEAKLKCSEERPCNRCKARGLECEPSSNTYHPPNGQNPDVQPHSSPAIGHAASTMHARQYSISEASDSGQLHANQVDPRLSQPMLTPTSPVSDPVNQAMQLHRPIQPAPAAHVNFSLPYDLDAFADYDTTMTMGSFLKDVMNPTSTSSFDPGSMTAMLPDVLDFTFDDFLDPTFDSFQGVSQLQPPTVTHVSSRDNTRSSGASGTLTPNVRKAADIGQQAFRESMWIWTPAKGDRRNADQAYLTVPATVTEPRSPDAPFPCHISLACRDRILSIVLRHCERDVQRLVVSQFPSTELLSAIFDTFTAYHAHQTLTWIHMPTLDLDEERDELLICLLATGASRSRHPEVRRLGSAMQGTARSAVAEMFEEDNRNTRDLRAIQSEALELHVGLWSGIRRNIEIAESFMLPFVTMLRRGGRFRKTAKTTTEHSEDPTANENRWRQWVEAESWKRLVFHAFYEATCTSMCLFNPPLIDPCELQVELPCSRKLWEAATADEWRNIVQLQNSDPSYSLPTLRSCIADIGNLIRQRAFVDVQQSFMLVIGTVWSRVWHWRQQKALAVLAGNGNGNSLPVTSHHQELVNICKQLSLSDSDVEGGINAHPRLMLEICQLHLHVSLEDIQLFAGKEGHEEARKTVAALRSWVTSTEARHSVYHAGQIAKAASRYPFGYLTGFPAVAVYHASLVLWAYAVLSGPNSVIQLKSEDVPSPRDTELICLDGDESQAHLQRFLMLGKGNPCIKQYNSYQSHGQDQHTGNIISLADAGGIMESITNLLASKNGDEKETPPFVSNLIKLMSSLGKAASVMRRR